MFGLAQIPWMQASAVQAWLSLQSAAVSHGLQSGAMSTPQTLLVQVAVVQASLSSVQSAGVSQGSQPSMVKAPQTLPTQVGAVQGLLSSLQSCGSAQGSQSGITLAPHLPASQVACLVQHRARSAPSDAVGRRRCGTTGFT
jgi:hypothetical protein